MTALVIAHAEQLEAELAAIERRARGLLADPPPSETWPGRQAEAHAQAEIAVRRIGDARVAMRALISVARDGAT